MRKFRFLFIIITICIFLISCAYDKVEIYDGKEYKNIDIKLEYVSPNSVNVTVSVDIFQNLFSETYIVDACVVLVSNDTIIGSEIFSICPGTVAGCFSKIHNSETKEVYLEYYNFDTIIAYVDGVEAYYHEEK